MHKDKKVAVFGCKHTTKELIQGLTRSGILVDFIVTISPQKGAEQSVAGYYDLREFAAQNNIQLVTVPMYNLKSEECQELLRSLKIDIALVMGWQRLLPGWLLNSLSSGAFGMHGSNRPLPHGRGRSPLNWSLIQNKRFFFTHLFKYSTGVDDGPIVDVQKFQINEYDTCLTLHYKNTISMCNLVTKNINAIAENNIALQSQDERYASYYPKRSAEDGLIFWQDTTTDIHNLIRAVTRPFPGAFSFSNDSEKIVIWSAQPFDMLLDWPDSQFGEILEVFENNNFVIKTGDGTLLVTKYEGAKITTSEIGTILSSNGLERKMWQNLPK